MGEPFNNALCSPQLAGLPHAEVPVGRQRGGESARLREEPHRVRPRFPRRAALKRRQGAPHPHHGSAAAAAAAFDDSDPLLGGCGGRGDEIRGLQLEAAEPRYSGRKEG